MKTLAIRLEDEQHARLTLLAKLADESVTDAIRQAIDSHIAHLASNPEIAAKADALGQEIDREAAEQRAALHGLFGNEAAATPKPASTTATTNRGRSKASTD